MNAKEKLRDEIGESNCYMDELLCNLTLNKTNTTKKLMIAIRDIHSNPLLEDPASIDISFFTIEDENADEENEIQEYSDNQDQDTQNQDQDTQNQDQETQNQDQDTENQNQNAENQDQDTENQNQNAENQEQAAQNQKKLKKKKGTKKKSSANTKGEEKEKKQGVTEDIPEEMNFLLKDVNIKEKSNEFTFTFETNETNKEKQTISFEINNDRLVDQILLYLKNSIDLTKVLRTEDNFDKIYQICERIAAENDKDAMSFAVREEYVYVTEKKGNHNVFTKAADDNNLELVRLLIESGIKINIADKNNSTALNYADKNDNEEIVNLLKAHGAK